jgi:hypothetical protein
MRALVSSRHSDRRRRIGVPNSAGIVIMISRGLIPSNMIVVLGLDHPVDQTFPDQ